MKSGVSNIKGNNDLLSKLKYLEKCQKKNAFLITADVVGLYLSIPHYKFLRRFKKAI